MTLSHQPIGVYDSGVGGLTVLKALAHHMPHENFVYFGDTANLPYGTKTPEQIIEFSRNIIAWFQNTLGAKMVIAACHTSSALALDVVAQDFTIPIIGTIYPCLNTLRAHKHHQRVGIIATPASATSRTHERIFKGNGFEGHVHSIPCPNFVPLIEATPFDDLAATQAAKEYLQAFHDHQLDTLIYGCTHYPFLKSIVESLLPPTMHYIDPAELIAREAQAVLLSTYRANGATTRGQLDFYCSSDTALFSQKIDRFLKIKDVPVTCATPTIS